MKNKVRKSLFASILSLVLCLSMAVGTTFAWFTDSVTSGVNKIVAGNLDVEVEFSRDMATWSTVEGATTLFSDVALWEPGATSVVYLKITNKGNLAVKYNLGIKVDAETEGTNVAGEKFKLSDYIKFGQVEDVTAKYADRAAAIAAVSASAQNIGAGYTFSGSMTAQNATKVIALVVYLPETVANEANYKTGTAAPTIDMGIELKATQLASESDSFDNQYDVGTPWLGGTDDTGLAANTDSTAKTVKIYSAEQLASFAAKVNAGTSYAGYTVTLEKDIDLNNVEWTPINYNKNDGMTFNGQEHTILNLKVNGTKYVGLFGAVTGADIKNVTIKNVDLTGVAYVGAIVGSIYGTVEKCKVENATINAVGEWNGTQYVDGAKAGAIVGLLREGSGEKILNCSAKNVTINGYRDLGGIVGCIYSKNTIKDNSISKITINQGDWSNYEDGNYTTMGAIYGRNISNGTGDIQANTGDATINKTIVATPTTVQSIIDNAQDGAEIILKAGTYGQLTIGNDKNTVNGLTLKATNGAEVKIAGVLIATACNTTPKTIKNIVFEGLTFTAKTDINSSNSDSVIENVKFMNCTFNIGSTAEGNQAIRFYNENNDGNVKNLTVENCSFNTCYQGVYTANINGLTVKNCTFDTTNHNAIAIQSTVHGAVNHKAVVITGNTFNNIGDRIMRFGDVAADTQITIKNNTATNSGDTDGQVIKATTLAAGITYDISGNSWGTGKIVANTELQD